MQRLDTHRADVPVSRLAHRHLRAKTRRRLLGRSRRGKNQERRRTANAGTPSDQLRLVTGSLAYWEAVQRRRALDHPQLRVRAGEGLPRHHASILHRGDDLVAKRSSRMVRRNRPRIGPEEIGGRVAVRTVIEWQLLAAAHLHDDGFQDLVVGRGAVGLEHAQAPRDGLSALEPALQHAEGTLLPLKVVFDDIAFEEQLARRSRAHLRGGRTSKASMLRQGRWRTR